jgi:ketosteroid isomerase-like protein
MTQENVEIIKAAHDAFNKHGFSSESALRFYDDAVVFEEPPEQPAPRTARGREAAVELFGQFDEAWEEHHSDLEETRVIDDERVLALTVEHFRGRDGIAIDQPCGTIFTLRGGRIIRMQSFWEQRNALEAAGLSA